MWSCTEILVLTYTPKRRPTHRKKSILIYIYNSHINNIVVIIRRINDFTMINLVPVNNCMNYLKPNIMQSNLQVFHRFRLSS